MAKSSRKKIVCNTPSDTSVIKTELVLPPDTNALGTLFGGVLMSWVDITASISAGRHARRPVVTASIDALHFLEPIRLGHYVHIKSMVTRVFRTSMEVGVKVESEDPLTGELVHNVSAYTTFVALDEKGNPTEVRELTPKSEDEMRRWKNAEIRRKARKKLAESVKAKKKNS